MKFQVRQTGDKKTILYRDGLWTLWQYIPVWTTSESLEVCKEKIESLRNGGDQYPILYKE